MIRLLIFVLFCYLVFLLCRAVWRLLPYYREVQRKTLGEEMVRDSHCGMFLPRQAAMEKKIRGETHFFCSAKCLDAFLADR